MAAAETLVFSSATTRHIISVLITGDEVVEREENLYLRMQLSFPDPRVNLSDISQAISIIDDDSKICVCMIDLNFAKS